MSMGKRTGHYTLTLVLTDEDMAKFMLSEYNREVTQQAIRSCAASILRDYGAVSAFTHEGITDYTADDGTGVGGRDEDEYTEQRNAGLTEENILFDPDPDLDDAA